MPEQLFRYVPCERSGLGAGRWTVISGPLELKPPPELEGAARPVPMMIVEWIQAGHPVEPID